MQQDQEEPVESQPFISKRSVRQALDSLLFLSKASPDEPNGLSHLTILDHALSDPAFPKVQNPREFAVQHLLVEVITKSLSLQRRNLNLERSLEYETLEEAKSAIQNDSQQQSPELIGWSILYYRYVRVDLNISPQQYHTYANIDERTSRRYQESALKRLAEVIAAQEWQMRRDFRYLHLFSLIPGTHFEAFVGRLDLIQYIYRIIEHNRPSHIQINGPHGIGKTALVRFILKNLIESNKVDQIVWIDRPTSVRYVQQQIYETLVRGQRISLQEIALMQRCFVVLDDVSLLAGDLDHLEALLPGLSDVGLFAINTFVLSLGESFKQLVVPEFNVDEVESLINLVRPHQYRDKKVLRATAQMHWDRVGGHPLIIRSALNQLGNVPLQSSLVRHDLGLYDEFFGEGYRALDLEMKQWFIAFMLIPVETVTWDGLKSLWPEYFVSVQEYRLVKLLSCGLIEMSPDADDRAYYKTDASRRFAQWLLGNDEHVIQWALDLVKDLEFDASPLVVEVVENALVNNLSSIDAGLKIEWIRAACYTGIEHGHYARWVSIFESVEHLPPDLHVPYATCLRRLVDYEKAEIILIDAVEQLGQHGEFVDQGKGLLELGILHTQTGLYEQALYSIQRAQRIAETLNDRELASKCGLELAQIALDRYQLENARNLLEFVDMSDIQAQILTIELHIAFDELHKAQELAVKASQSATQATLGRIYVLLGRITAMRDDVDAALSWFDASIVLLEQEQDVFALARAQSNRAALNLGRHEYLDEAQELLYQAEATQRTLQDRAGLVFTLHNMRVLHSLILSDVNGES